MDPTVRILEEESGAVGSLALPPGSTLWIPRSGMAVRSRIQELASAAASGEPLDVERLRRAAKDLSALVADEGCDAFLLPASLRRKPRDKGQIVASAHLQWGLERYGVVVLFPSPDGSMALADYDNASTVSILRRPSATARAAGWRARWEHLLGREERSSSPKGKVYPERLTMAAYAFDDVEALRELEGLDPDARSEIESLRARVHPIPWVAECSRRWWSIDDRRAA